MALTFTNSRPAQQANSLYNRPARQEPPIVKNQAQQAISRLYTQAKVKWGDAFDLPDTIDMARLSKSIEAMNNGAVRVQYDAATGGVMGWFAPQTQTPATNQMPKLGASSPATSYAAAQANNVNAARGIAQNASVNLNNLVTIKDNATPQLANPTATINASNSATQPKPSNMLPSALDISNSGLSSTPLDRYNAQSAPGASAEKGSSIWLPTSHMGAITSESINNINVNAPKGNSFLENLKVVGENIKDGFMQGPRLVGGAVKGAIETLLSPANMAQSAAQTVPEDVRGLLPGSGYVGLAPELQNSFDSIGWTQKAATTVDNITNKYVPKPTTTGGKIGAVLADEAGRAVPAVLIGKGTGAANALVGNSAARAAGFAQSFSRSVTGGESFEGATINAVADYASEVVGGKVFGKVSEKINNPALRMAAESAGEGLEENISGSIQSFAKGEQYSLEQAKTDFALGAGVGAIIGAGDAAISGLRNQYNQSKAQKAINSDAAATSAANNTTPITDSSRLLPPASSTAIESGSETPQLPASTTPNLLPSSSATSIANNDVDITSDNAAEWEIIGFAAQPGVFVSPDAINGTQPNTNTPTNNGTSLETDTNTTTATAVQDNPFLGIFVENSPVEQSVAQETPVSEQTETQEANIAVQNDTNVPQINVPPVTPYEPIRMWQNNQDVSSVFDNPVNAVNTETVASVGDYTKGELGDAIKSALKPEFQDQEIGNIYNLMDNLEASTRTFAPDRDEVFEIDYNPRIDYAPDEETVSPEPQTQPLETPVIPGEFSTLDTPNIQVANPTEIPNQNETPIQTDEPNERETVSAPNIRTPEQQLRRSLIDSDISNMLNNQQEENLQNSPRRLLDPTKAGNAAPVITSTTTPTQPIIRQDERDRVLKSGTSDFFLGRGSTGRIFESDSYNTTFGGLSSY